MAEPFELTPPDADRLALKIVPGSRIEVRDAEWLVKKTERDPYAGLIIYATGISGIVRNKDKIFVQSIEEAENLGKGIKVVDPVNTRLVPDESARYEDTRLYLQGLLLRAMPQTDTPVIGQNAAIDPLPYQLEPAAMALKAPRARILIADDVGLGKTLEAGILTAELMRRGRAKRILVVATKSMLTQFQKEFWTRFSIPLTRLDSVGIERVKQQIPVNHNPFNCFEKTIISIDTLKNHSKYRVYLENALWDLIIIDEAHNVAERKSSGSGNSYRGKLAALLAKRSDSLVMLSATPHDGSRRSFASLMLMLDPTAIANPEEYGPEDIRGLFIRRFRTDPAIKSQLGKNIPERHVVRLYADATEAEEEAYEELAGLSLTGDQVTLTSMGDGKTAQAALFKTTIEKALFSSPCACIETLSGRIKKLENSEQNAKNTVDDCVKLSKLRKLIDKIDATEFSKYNLLLSHLGSIGWNGSDEQDRLIIFTERIATLKWLEHRLCSDLGLSSEAVSTIHGGAGLSDIALQKRVDDFGQLDMPVRLLIATDMASEGINLHYFCHKLIHFDMPWSLMKFRQRNGRIDRYGQKKQPKIWYLFSNSKIRKIMGDQRILEVLTRKDEAARESIGDSSVFAGTNDAEEQERQVVIAVEAGKSAEALSEELDSNAQNMQNSDFGQLEQLLRNAGKEGPADAAQPSAPTSMIYDSVLAFAKAGLRHRNLSEKVLGLEVPEPGRLIRLKIPVEFTVGNGATSAGSIDTRWMPREAVPKDLYLNLTDDRAAVAKDIESARMGDADSWPGKQFFWELHPLAEWLLDNTASMFDRGTAPVVVLRKAFEPDEVAFLIHGVVPNRKGQPLVDEWMALMFKGSEYQGSTDLAKFLTRSGLTSGANSGFQPINPGNIEASGMRALVEEAVRRAQGHMRSSIATAKKNIGHALVEQNARLDDLKKKHKLMLQHQFDLGKGIKKIREAMLQSKLKEAEDMFLEHRDWIRDTRQLAEAADPHVRIVAAFRG